VPVVLVSEDATVGRLLEMRLVVGLAPKVVSVTHSKWRVDPLDPIRFQPSKGMPN
jgi:hypothetical protein